MTFGSLLEIQTKIGRVENLFRKWLGHACEVSNQTQGRLLQRPISAYMYGSAGVCSKLSHFPSCHFQ